MQEDADIRMVYLKTEETLFQGKAMDSFGIKETDINENCADVM